MNFGAGLGVAGKTLHVCSETTTTELTDQATGCGKVHKPQVIVKLHGGCCRSYGQNRFGTYDPLQPKKRP